MRIFRNLDISGQHATFLLFGRHKSQTFLGGILTIIIFILGVICLFLFGQDFLFRKNPNIITSLEQTPEMTVMRENSTTFPVYFRLEDRDGAPVNFTGIFYPYSVFWEYHQDENGMRVPNRTSISRMEKCKENNQNYIDEDPTNYYCMNWNNEPWGGNGEGELYSFYTFFLSFCPTGFYDKNTCTPTDVIDELIEKNNMWYFSFFYPTYTIQPNNLEEPLKITYKNYARRLGRNLVKVDKFDFQNVVLNDDQGILWNSYRNITKIAMFEVINEYVFTDNHEDSLKPGQVAFIYQANFNFVSQFHYITRSFQKLQDIAASVGGVLKCFMVVINLLSVNLNYNNIIDKIIGHMFDWSKPVAGDNMIMLNISNNVSGDGIKTIGEKTKVDNYLKTTLDNANMTENIKRREVDYANYSKNTLERKTDQALSKINKQKTQKAKRPDSLFRFRFHYLPFLLTKSPTNKDLYTAYAFADAQARKRMDIEYYIKLLFDFTHMQKILLKEYQMVAIEHSKKPNIYQRKELGELYGMYTKEEEEMRYKKQLPTLKNMSIKNNNENNKVLIDIMENMD